MYFDQKSKESFFRSNMQILTKSNFRKKKLILLKNPNFDQVKTLAKN